MKCSELMVTLTVDSKVEQSAHRCRELSIHLINCPYCCRDLIAYFKFKNSFFELLNDLSKSSTVWRQLRAQYQTLKTFDGAQPRFTLIDDRSIITGCIVELNQAAEEFIIDPRGYLKDLIAPDQSESDNIYRKRAMRFAISLWIFASLASLNWQYLYFYGNDYRDNHDQFMLLTTLTPLPSTGFLKDRYYLNPISTGPLPVRGGNIPAPPQITAAKLKNGVTAKAFPSHIQRGNGGNGDKKFGLHPAPKQEAMMSARIGDRDNHDSSEGAAAEAMPYPAVVRAEGNSVSASLSSSPHSRRPVISDRQIKTQASFISGGQVGDRNSAIGEDVDDDDEDDVDGDDDNGNINSKYFELTTKGESINCFVMIDNQTTAPRLLVVPNPEITAAAREHKIDKLLSFEISFRHDGTIAIVQKHQYAGYGLDEVALDAVKRIQFIPATRNGQKIDLRGDIIVRFSSNLPKVELPQPPTMVRRR